MALPVRYHGLVHMRLLLSLVLVVLGGCWSQTSYLVTSADLQRAAAAPPAERVPASRLPEGRPVRLRAWALQDALRTPSAVVPPIVDPAAAGQAPSPADPAPAWSPRPARLGHRVTLRQRDPLLTAAIVLTCVGSVVSVAGSIVYFATWGQDSPAHLAGAITGLGAEPIMWAGTILWPIALMRPPAQR